MKEVVEILSVLAIGIPALSPGLDEVEGSAEGASVAADAENEVRLEEAVQAEEALGVEALQIRVAERGRVEGGRKRGLHARVLHIYVFVAELHLHDGHQRVRHAADLPRPARLQHLQAPLSESGRKSGEWRTRHLGELREEGLALSVADDEHVEVRGG